MSSKPQSKEEDKKASKTQKTLVSLEEDDEFEDFPVEDWKDTETEVAAASGKAHLWEEQWDDDDADEDFAQQLREELKKTNGAPEPMAH